MLSPRLPLMKPRPSRGGANEGPKEAVVLASCQQLASALLPQSTTPRSQASRSTVSSPCWRQMASKAAVLPPPT